MLGINFFIIHAGDRADRSPGILPFYGVFGHFRFSFPLRSHKFDTTFDTTLKTNLLFSASPPLSYPAAHGYTNPLS